MSQNNSVFRTPLETHFGRGVVTKVGASARQFGERALVVTGTRSARHLQSSPPSHMTAGTFAPPRAGHLPALAPGHKARLPPIGSASVPPIQLLPSPSDRIVCP